MSIKMPLRFHGSYKVVTRQGGMEKQEICQKLSITPIVGQDPDAPAPPENPSTYLITYFCFGCRRVLEGKIMENVEGKAVFQVDEREYEFSPTTKAC